MTGDSCVIMLTGDWCVLKSIAHLFFQVHCWCDVLALEEQVAGCSCWHLCHVLC